MKRSVLFLICGSFYLPGGVEENEGNLKTVCFLAGYKAGTLPLGVCPMLVFSDRAEERAWLYSVPSGRSFTVRWRHLVYNRIIDCLNDVHKWNSLH
jgi:hypothetical protein